jgi:hypothetical protein
MDTDALIANLAAELSIPGPTVRKWRERGRVPYHRRDMLRDQAAGHGFILRAEHFDSFGRAQSVAA